MPHPDSPIALLDARAVAPYPRAMQHAFLWILASLVTASGLLGLGFALADRSERQAGRMIVEAQGQVGYLTIVVGGFAARHGQPSR